MLSQQDIPPKELEQESHNRLPLFPHHQTIPSLTSNPCPTALVLARYKWVVPEPCVCSTPIWVHGLFAVYAFAIACGFVWSYCAFCCSFLTLCGVDEPLGLHSLHFISSLGWVLLGYRPFLLQYSPCLLSLLVRGSIDTSTVPLYCFCHVLLNCAYRASFGSTTYFSFT